uniref:Uncharacterized protein n=1 Tax=Anopheles farauti TaxID=69004 RepID=A0A182QN74_9DIPT
MEKNINAGPTTTDAEMAYTNNVTTDNSYASSSGSDSEESNASLLERSSLLSNKFMLPKDLCDNGAIFDEFFSHSLWDSLPPVVQQHLAKFLPNETDDPASSQAAQVVHCLLANKLQRFGQDQMSILRHKLSEGNFRVDMARLQNSMTKSIMKDKRMVEFQRLARLAQNVVMSREAVLLSELQSTGTHLLSKSGRVMDNCKHRRRWGFQLNNSSEMEKCQTQAKKRYLSEIVTVSDEVGLSLSLSDEEDCLHALPTVPVRKQRRMFGGSQMSEQSYASSAGVAASTSNGGVKKSSIPSNCNGAGGNTFDGTSFNAPKLFLVTEEHYKKLLLEHRKRKVEEPDHPELNLDGIKMKDVFLAGDYQHQPEDFVPYIDHKVALNILQWIGASRDADSRLVPLCAFWQSRKDEIHKFTGTQTLLHAYTPSSRSDDSGMQAGVKCRSKSIAGSRLQLSSSSSSSSSSSMSSVSSAQAAGDLSTTLLSECAIATSTSVLGGPVQDDDGSISERSVTPPPPLFPTDWSVRKATDEEIQIFREQEKRRYENPHMAFTYKQHSYDSVVGPVKGIYTQAPGISKARGHSMLVADRPNFVTILTLVRDATARLPNGEGTRADICELLKSSQYISPTATDQILQTIVSGALDRMHTEHDPCVKYDAKRKIWIYLHRNRTEQEFERLHIQYQGFTKHKKSVVRKSLKYPKDSVSSANLSKRSTLQATKGSTIIAATIGKPIYSTSIAASTMKQSTSSAIILPTGAGSAGGVTPKMVLSSGTAYASSTAESSNVPTVVAIKPSSATNIPTAQANTNARVIKPTANLISTITLAKGQQAVLTPAQQKQIIQNLLSQHQKQALTTKKIVSHTTMVSANSPSFSKAQATETKPTVSGPSFVLENQPTLGAIPAFKIHQNASPNIKALSPQIVKITPARTKSPSIASLRPVSNMGAVVGATNAAGSPTAPSVINQAVSGVKMMKMHPSTILTSTGAQGILNTGTVGSGSALTMVSSASIGATTTIPQNHTMRVLKTGTGTTTVIKTEMAANSPTMHQLSQGQPSAHQGLEKTRKDSPAAQVGSKVIVTPNISGGQLIPLESLLQKQGITATATNVPGGGNTFLKIAGTTKSGQQQFLQFSTGHNASGVVTSTTANNVSTIGAVAGGGHQYTILPQGRNIISVASTTPSRAANLPITIVSSSETGVAQQFPFLLLHSSPVRSNYNKARFSLLKRLSQQQP